MDFAICYGELDDPQATIDILLKNDISIIETGPDFFLNSEDEKISQTAKAFMEKGINIRSVHAPFGNSCNLSDLDRAKREKAIQIHEMLLYKTAIAGVEMIIIHPGEKTQSENNIENMNRIAIDSISQLVGTAEETGVRLAVENLPPKCPGAKTEHIVNILENVDSISLGVCFDVGHANIMNNMVEFIDTIGNSIITIHLHDNDGTYDMHLQPPYGTTDWYAFSEMIRDIAYTEPLTIEAAPWTGASFNQMVKEVSAVIDNALYPDDQQTNTNIGLRCLKCGHAILRNEGKWFCNCDYRI